MLVITREVNEKVMIGDDIEIMLIEIRGKEVRIGISAPKDVNIRRAELAYREPDV